MACDQSWTFHKGEFDRPDVRALLALHLAAMHADSPAEACHVLPIDALRDPAIHFLSLRDSRGKLLGVGALKTLNDAHGEIKSMRTVSDQIGRGVGSFLLTQLTATARSMSMKRLSLETGSSPPFAAANRLYKRAGFERCGPFGGYSDTSFTFFYTRSIDVSPPEGSR
jgi:putative acetyltransferase